MLLVKNANYNGNGVDILSLDGTITKIEKDIKNYYGIEEIDLKGKRIFPSLIDGRVHVTGGGGAVSYTHLTLPTIYSV